MKRSFLQQAWLVVLALCLAACGGDKGAGLVLPGASLYTLELETTPSTVTSAAQPVTLNARLLDPDGAAVPGATLAFSSSAGRLAVTSAQTDGAGRASAVLYAGSAGPASGVVTVRFTDPGRSVATAEVAVSTLGNETSTPGPGGGDEQPTMTLVMRSGSGLIVDAANPVTDSAPGTLRATLLNADGTPASGIIVTFAADQLVDLSQTTALTDASGIAQVSVTAAGAGAGSATASATVETVPLTRSVVFAAAVGTGAETPLVLDLGVYNAGTFTADVLTTDVPDGGEVAPGSVVTISADVVDTATNTPYTNSVTVSFRSTCATAGKATIDAAVTTVNGRATAVYRPSGCVGSDTVVAEVRTATQTLTASTTLTMATENVGSIAFVSVNPEGGTIALKGTGGAGRLETAEVRFRVVGEQGNPISGRSVCFGLSTTSGGLALSPERASSNSAGEVVAIVTAGTVPTPVRVNAYVDDTDTCADAKPSPLVQTVSDVLTVSTGLPHQRSFSLAVLPSDTTPAYSYNGVIWDVTIYAADRFHNPVPDGTAINFWTELGAIDPSCITSGKNGTCSVKWRSQTPRSNYDTRSAGVNGLPLRDRPGRSVIVAYAVGEESFFDANGNGQFDAAELGSVDQLSEVIKDSNGNGIRESADEEFVDFDGDSQFDAANTRFDGVLCSSTTSVANCSGDATVHVRDYNEIVMSTNIARVYLVHPDADLSAVDFTGGEGAVLMSGISNPADTAYDYSGETISTIYGLRGGQFFRVIATDSNGNQLSPGTTITVEVNEAGGSIDGKNSYTLARVGSLYDWFDGVFALKAPEDTPAVPGLLRVIVGHTDGTEQEIIVSTVDWVTP